MKELIKGLKVVIQVFTILCLCYHFIIVRFLKLNNTRLFLEEHSLENLIFISATTSVFLFLIIYTIRSLKKKETIAINNQTKIIEIIKIKYEKLLDTILYQPLKEYDKTFKKIIRTKFKMERSKIINNFLNYLYHYSIKRNQRHKSNIYIYSFLFLKIIPKVITVIMFLIDIFYYNKIYYFYWCLPLFVIPLLLQYIKYIIFEEYFFLHTDIAQKLEVIETATLVTLNNGQKAFHFTYLSIAEYLDKAIIYDLTGELNPYKNKIGLSYEYLNARPKEELSKKYDYTPITKHYLKYLAWIEKVHLIFYFLKCGEKKYDAKTNLIIYFCYFIGWGYIMINLLFNIFPEYFVFIPIQYDPFTDLLESKSISYFTHIETQVSQYEIKPYDITGFDHHEINDLYDTIHRNNDHMSKDVFQTINESVTDSSNEVD